MSACVTFPMAAALRCTHHYELDVKIASANASIAAWEGDEGVHEGNWRSQRRAFPNHPRFRSAVRSTAGTTEAW